MKHLFVMGVLLITFSCVKTTHQKHIKHYPHHNHGKVKIFNK